MTDESKEERDVAEAQTAVAEAVRRGDDFMRVNGYVRALESAIEARTLAKLRAGVPPLTWSTADEQRCLSDIGEDAGYCVGSELGALRAALAARDEWLTEEETQRDELNIQMADAEDKLAAMTALIAPGERIAFAALRAALAEARERAEQLIKGDEMYSVIATSAQAHVDKVVAACDARIREMKAKLAALVEAASDASWSCPDPLHPGSDVASCGWCVGATSANAKLAAALEAARGA